MMWNVSFSSCYVDIYGLFLSCIDDRLWLFVSHTQQLSLLFNELVHFCLKSDHISFSQRHKQLQKCNLKTHKNSICKIDMNTV